ncbi:MAG: ABC transporter substrate-binding protein [Proteobacteria bacterium]|nr:ABC transporter substrate-binding protein [Pseudomonadota bacterium]
MSPRVVSLLPGATEIVAALGLVDRLVGRSHACDHPPEIQALPALSAPELGDAPSAVLHRDVAARARRALAIYRIDHDRLAALAPDVILTQTLCEVCAVGPGDLAAYVDAMRPGAALVALGAADLAGLFADMARIAAACGAPARAAPLIARLEARLDRLAAAVAGAPRPRVVCLEWLDPLMAAGNWTPELVARAGGEPALGRAGAHSGTIALGQLAAADPDVIVVAPCSFDLARSRAELPALAATPAWQALRAVRTGAVHLADGNRFFNRPGPRLVDTAEMLGEILHPDRAAYGHHGDAWVRW